MERHVKNYLEASGFDGYTFMPCELCQSQGVEIHHVESRSKFGSKRKDEQDHISNLVCLCRSCHDKAHGPESRWYKEKLKAIIAARSF